MIPVCDLSAQVAQHRAELDAAIARVLDSGWFVLGRECAEFETEFAAWIARAGEEADRPEKGPSEVHCVGVASGTDAIHLALRAVGIKAGDKVLTAPNSAVPTACGIIEAGAVPCFADVDPEYGLLDPASMAEELDTSVRAIVVVQLYGRSAPMDRVRELGRKWGIPVIEDAAQAHGATWNGEPVGTMGQASCFSFYPSKNLGALGDGGAVTTTDPEIAERLRRLRNYGQRNRYEHVELGFNSRLDEMQAAILRAKLPHLSNWNERRRAIASRYRQALTSLPVEFASDPESVRSVEHLFVVRVARRDRFRDELEALGVGTQIHYPIPIHLQEAFASLGHGTGRFPVAEKRSTQIASLPLYPEMTDDQVEQVIEAVTKVLAGEPHPDEESA